MKDNEENMRSEIRSLDGIKILMISLAPLCAGTIGTMMNL